MGLKLLHPEHFRTSTVRMVEKYGDEILRRLQDHYGDNFFNTRDAQNFLGEIFGWSVATKTQHTRIILTAAVDVNILAKVGTKYSFIDGKHKEPRVRIKGKLFGKSFERGFPTATEAVAYLFDQEWPILIESVSYEM
jgi:hypothetical protein